jgi:hypothetical protein
MSWNKHEAVLYARSHAHHESLGYCARAVAAAIRAGGLKIEGADAKDFWRSLEKVGFSKTYGTPLKAMLQLSTRCQVKTNMDMPAFMMAPAPGILISNKEPYTLARHIEKFSQKSQFTGIHNEKNITFTLHVVCWC